MKKIQEEMEMSRIVIALGGNALGSDALEQREKIREACPSLVGLIAQGHEIIISHGNGPQVGMIHTAFDTASRQSEKVPRMDLMECTAMSQGYIGYHLQQGIGRELRIRKMPWHVATVVTQTLVDAEDEAFSHPEKPIGAFYTKEEAEELKKRYPHFVFREDSGRGYRRMVPSPKPVDIVEKASILNLLDNEYIVIACGGGGIPVVRDQEGNLNGVPAVVDKDYASAKLAEAVGAEYLFILTAVDRVCLDFGLPTERGISEMTADEAEKWCREGQFAPGSMLPKVEAAITFARAKAGNRAVIASLKEAPLAMRGESGTVICGSSD